MADNSTMTHEEERFHGGKDTTLPANHPINALSPLRKFLALSALAFCGLMGNFSCVNPVSTMNASLNTQCGDSYGRLRSHGCRFRRLSW